jgi:hypothetical protein
MASTATSPVVENGIGVTVGQVRLTYDLTKPAKTQGACGCCDCRHQIEPDPAAMAERYAADLSVPDWHKRLVCGQCGGRKIDFVVTSAKP